jgi:hypothetical protein
MISIDPVFTINGRDFYICDWCGAAVLGRNLHLRFHELNQDSPAGPPRTPAERDLK